MTYTAGMGIPHLYCGLPLHVCERHVCHLFLGNLGALLAGLLYLDAHESTLQ